MANGKWQMCLVHQRPRKGSITLSRMAVPTASGHAQCPECFADVTLTDVMQNEITQCPGCGAELEISSLSPLTLLLAPQEEEDWGE
jgi:alpha-aminoadipate carrier protein LysW